MRLCIYLHVKGPPLRDHLINFGITHMSAGSKTNPGGYSGKTDAVEQFEVNDTRSPSEVAAMLAIKRP